MTLRISVVLAGFVSLSLSGCGAGKGEVSGKVTFQGKTHLVSGTVVILASDQKPYHGLIGEDGSYKIEGVPPGECKVAVSSPNPKGEQNLRGSENLRGSGRSLGGDVKTEVKFEADNAAAAAPKGWFPIDPKYEDFASSGISLTVTSGKNTLDIDLK